MVNDYRPDPEDSREERAAAWVARLQAWEDHASLTTREAADLADLLAGYMADTGAGIDTGRQEPAFKAPEPQRPNLPAGWGWPGHSRKAHYFPEGELTSLCRKWGFYAGLREPDDHPSSDDCVACRRKLDAS